MQQGMVLLASSTRTNLPWAHPLNPAPLASPVTPGYDAHSRRFIGRSAAAIAARQATLPWVPTPADRYVARIPLRCVGLKPTYGRGIALRRDRLRLSLDQVAP